MEWGAKQSFPAAQRRSARPRGRGIERVTEIHHTTIMNWIEDAGLKLPDAPEESEIAEITEIDELFAKLILEDKLWWEIKKIKSGSGARQKAKPSKSLSKTMAQ